MIAMAASSDHLETMNETQSLDNSEVYPLFLTIFINYYVLFILYYTVDMLAGSKNFMIMHCLFGIVRKL